jgi:hypothetical protein
MAITLDDVDEIAAREEPMISIACARLIERAADYGPLYATGLSNHLPMALIALDRMGASPARLEAFYARYAPRLARRGQPDTPLDPRDSWGVARNFEGVFAYFRALLAAQGKERVLQIWLPVLMPGVATGAFHPMIRLAYAVDAYEESEMAFGLASWVTEHRSLDGLGAPTRRTLDDIVQSLSHQVAQHALHSGLIIDRLVEVSQLPAVRLAATQPEHLQFADVANFAIRMYAAREDFTVLHMVTGCHAFRLLIPYLDDVANATRHLWHAMMLAYLSTGLTPQRLNAASAATNLDWPRCLARAVQSDNDHVIKLAYTAWREASVTQDPLYLYAACRIACGADLSG